MQPEYSGSLGLGSNGLALKRTLATNPTPFTLAHATPDAELLAVRKGELETVILDNAATADFFGLAGRRTTLGKEEVWIDTEAVGKLLP